jgi:hypothetical protein
MAIITEIDRLMDNYRAWLREKTTLREVGSSWVEITTPFLDRNNDLLQIYARQSNGGYLLTDDSYIIHDLEASGCSLSTPKRQDLLKLTLNGFGVKLNDGALEIQATAETFPLRKHNLIQAMLAVNDLFYTAKPVVESLFFEDVVSWLDSSDIRYIPKAKFTGVSGYDHLFDFVIPKSRREPERFLQAINKPTRNTAENFIYKWTDTRDVRGDNSRAYAVLNDTEGQVIPGEVFEAFRNYEIRPVPWSHRAEVVAELSQ